MSHAPFRSCTTTLYHFRCVLLFKGTFDTLLLRFSALFFGAEGMLALPSSCRQRVEYQGEYDHNSIKNLDRTNRLDKRESWSIIEWVRATTSEYATPAMTSKFGLNTRDRSLNSPPRRSMIMNKIEIPITSRCLYIS